jgi:4-carboxymuconolactone decarboxylase
MSRRLACAAALLSLSIPGPVFAAETAASTKEGISMNEKPAPRQGEKLFGDIAPKFGQLTDDVLFGDVWARSQLSPRDRSLVTISALIALNRPDQLRPHLQRARDNGVTQDEIIETITHLAFYAGWPNAVTAIGVARDVFKQ